MSDVNINRGWSFKWNDLEDDIINKFYPSGGCSKVLELLPNRNIKGIQSRAHKLGVSYLNYNENYFSNIDTCNKAYWLGFMYTDGYVTTENRWGLELSIIDIEHMKKFLNEFDCNINIKVRDRKNSTSCSFQIKNKIMFDNFVRCGVIKNKSTLLEFPPIDILPREFYLDFIRGLFDGDGSFVFYKYDRVRKDRNNKIYNTIYKESSFVCKSESFIIKLKQTIFEETGVNFNLTCNSRDNLPTLRISKSKDLIKFIEYLYSNIDISHSLERKFQKAQEILKYCLV